MQNYGRLPLLLTIAACALAFALAPGATAETLESEPNDVPVEGESLASGMSGRGVIGASDTDYWVYNATADGWAKVVVNLGSGIVMTLDGPSGAPQTEMPASSNITYFELTDATATWVIFSASTTGQMYTFTFEVKGALSAFSEGTDEIEPNDAAADATLLTAGLNALGTVDGTIDPVDYFKVTAVKGDYVEVYLEKDYTETAALSLERVSGFHGGPTNPVDLIGELFDIDGEVVFAVRTTGSTVGYTIEVTRAHTSAYADGKITLSEAYNDTVIDAFLHPATDPPISSRGSNLATGAGLMWGETLCLETALATEVRGISIVAGQRADPVDTDLQRMVVSLSMNLTIPYNEPACFHAISYDEEGVIPYDFEPYRPGAMLTGDALKVMEAIDQRGTDDAGAQLALWAVTSGTTEARAREWSASTATIQNARAILASANVTTPLNPSTTSPTNNNNNNNQNTGGTGGTGTVSAPPPWGLIAGLSILVLIVVGAAAAASGKRKRAAMAAWQVPPPGQAPPPGGAYPGAPSYAYGQTSAPPAYGQPVPPAAYGRPAAPPPYGGSAPGQGAMYASPVAPPPAAAPVAPSQPVVASADTMPCPQCQTPLAFYTPVCGRCGMQLNWS